MKKTYCKPQIAFEDFELSANIAETCRLSAGPNDVAQCGYVIPGIGKIFFSSYRECEFQVFSDGSYYGLCYHIPMESTCLFNS